MRLCDKRKTARHHKNDEDKFTIIAKQQILANCHKVALKTFEISNMPTNVCKLLTWLTTAKLINRKFSAVMIASRA